MFGEDVAYVQEPHDVAMADGDEAAGEDSLDDQITPTDSWFVIEAYFAKHSLVSQQIDSFNNFVNHRLQVRQPQRAACAHRRPAMARQPTFVHTHTLPTPGAKV
jgi:hypothetical protein